MAFTLFFSNLMLADIFIENKRSKENDKSMLIRYKDPATKETMELTIPAGKEQVLENVPNLKTISISSPRGLGSVLPPYKVDLSHYKQPLLITITERPNRKFGERIYKIEVKELNQATALGKKAKRGWNEFVEELQN